LSNLQEAFFSSLLEDAAPSQVALPGRNYLISSNDSDDIIGNSDGFIAASGAKAEKSPQQYKAVYRKPFNIVIAFFFQMLGTDGR
jgi:hypothetical protein